MDQVQEEKKLWWCLFTYGFLISSMSSVSCFSMGFYFALIQSLYLYESRSAFVWVAENKRFFLYLVGSLWFDELQEGYNGITC